MVDSGNNRIVELPAGGAQITLGFSGLNSPTGVAVDGAGDVIVGDTFSNRVVELRPGGGQITLPCDAPDPAWVAVDGAGNMYVSDIARRSVDELPAPPSVVVTVAGSQGAGGGATFVQVNDAPPGIAVAGR